MAALRAVPALLLAGVALLAGCASPDDAETDAEGPDYGGLGLEASDTTGILRGVVIDEAIRPLEGVEVNARGAEANRTMATGPDGLFGFDGLPPGTYFITAVKAGFAAAQTSTEVQAGVADPAAVRIQLSPDAATAPYIQDHHLDGYITCSVRPMFLGLQCGFFSSSDVVNANYDLARVPDWVQSEMRWQSTQATGDELSLAIRCLPGDDTDPAGRCADGQQTIARAEGHSPQVASFNRTVAENWTLGPAGNPLSLSIFVFGRSDLDAWNEEAIYAAQEPVTGDPCLYWPDQGLLFGPGTCMRATGPGLVVNQKVDVFTHVFYGFTPAEGWTFGEDGPHPLPPS